MSEVTALAERAAVAGNGVSARYVEQFQRLYREQGAGLAVDAADAAERAAALEELAAVGFPLRHDEEWAHTPVRAVVEPAYRLGSADAAVQTRGGLAAALVADDPVPLVTVNGRVANSAAVRGTLAGGAAPVTEVPGLGLAPRVVNSATGRGNGERGGRRSPAVAPVTEVPGVQVASAGAAWDGAASPDPAATAAGIAFTRPTGNAFTRLARVFGSAVELRLDAAVGDAPLHLLHLSEAGVVSAPRVRIVVAAGARVTLVESCVPLDDESAGDAPALACGDTEIHLGAGAALNYVRVQAAAENAFDLGSTTVVQARDSELHALSVAVGARLARHTLNVLAAGPGTSSRLGGAAVAASTVAGAPQVIDNHTYLEHAAPSCASRQLYKMVLGGGGHGVFSGRILVRPVAQQTDAFQLNQNLLLDDAVVDTKPQLEIGADDVRCTHGATTGRLNRDQLFYLQTRGIPQPAALQMLARGFLDEVVGDLPVPALRPRLLELLHRRLDRLAWSTQP